MPTYSFPQFKTQIIDPTIIKHGQVVGTFIDNVSQGGFEIDIILKTDNYQFGFRLVSVDTQPVAFTVEEIDIWITNELIKFEL